MSSPTDAPTTDPRHPGVAVPGALGSDFGWAVRQVSMTFQALGAEAVAHLPQGARGYLVLVAAGAGAAPTQLDLVQRLGIDKTSMTRLIDALEAGDLVARRPDHADRRARRVEITPSGTAALGRARTRLEQIEQALLAPLTVAEGAAFRSMLARVAGQVDSTTSCEV